MADDFSLGSTPLPTLDRAAADALWARYLASLDDAERAEVPAYSAFETFGDTVEMADELLDLVVHGPKRATAGSVASYEAEGEPLPTVGDHWIVADGSGRPRAVIRTDEVRIGPLSSVDDAFAWDEGEGDRTRDWWVRAHLAFFERYHGSLGLPHGPDMELVFERFSVVYVDDAPTGEADSAPG